MEEILMGVNRDTIQDRIKEIILNNNKKYVKLLVDLVKIPSISANKNPDPLYKIIEFINKKLITLQFLTQIHDEFDSNYPLLTARNTDYSDKFKDRSKILWLAHSDVQPPGDFKKWKKLKDPFKPKEVEGKLYGRGALDTKSQLAAQICAIDVVNQLATKLRPLEFIYTTDEEIGSSNSTLKFFDHLLKSDTNFTRYFGAINGENTKERIVLGCKGIIKCKITAIDPLGREHSGKSMFHAFQPILNLSRFFTQVREENQILIKKINSLNPKVKLIENNLFLTEEELKNDKEIPLSIEGLKIALGSNLWNYLIADGWSPKQIAEKFASVSFNPNYFLAGSGMRQTIVPDRAFSEVDIRLPPRVDPTKIIEIFQEFVNQFPNIKLEIIMPSVPNDYKYFQGAYTSPNNSFVKFFHNLCMHVYKKPRIIMPISSGTSDGRFLEVLGIPHLKFGTKGRNNHSYDEYVDLASFFRVIEVYSSMMIDFGED